MKKKGLLITVIILLVLALIGGIFAYIFFATDTFLSEKERFAKYALKIGNEKSGFVTSTLNNYFEKKNNTAYTNNGSINANVQILTNISDDELSKKVQSLLEAGNNTTIQFNGKIDNPNKKIEEEITLKYTDTESFPIKFKRDGDIYGLQSDNVMTSYIAFENNNLKELARKFGVYDVSQIPDKIELKEMSLTEEEIRYRVGDSVSFPADHVDKESQHRTSEDRGYRDKECKPCALHEELPSRLPYECLLKAYCERFEEAWHGLSLTKDDYADRRCIVDIREGSCLIPLRTDNDIHADIILTALYAWGDGLERHLVELRGIAISACKTADEVRIES